jgi:ribosomal protein S18 acetylase RimI-like enzyme
VINLVRELEPSDLEGVLDVHMEAFQGFFLSFLGRRFLFELYGAILNDPSGIAYVYEDDAVLVGFVAGTDQPAGFYGRLIKQKWWRFGLASIGPVLSRPGIIPRLLRAFTKPKDVAHLEHSGMLMSIAVHPDAHGRGIGRVLVKSFLQEAAKRNLRFVTLTTDKFNNERTNTFYQKYGFECRREFETPEGRWMYEYMIDLHKQSGVQDKIATLLPD